MITIRDVAKLADVSIATVSNVINNNAKVSAETAARVKQAVLDLNYIPNNIAKGLKKNTTKTIGVLVEDISNFSSPFIIDGICQQCELLDYHIIVDNLRVNKKVNDDIDDMFEHLARTDEFQRSVGEAVNTLLSARICGLIYIGVHPRNVSGLLPPMDVPVVYTYCYADSPASDKAQNISYDDFQGALLAVNHIIGAGHSKITIIGGMINSYAARRRMTGYQTALMENGLPINPEYIVSGNWTYESGYALANRLFDLPNPPTAIFAMNDLMAFGAIDALKKRGICVPGDVAVHGFDDLQAAQFFSPPLTTIALPLHEIGEKATDSVVKMTVNNIDISDDKYVLIPCRHVERESV